jgi:hypothetical protein
LLHPVGSGITIPIQIDADGWRLIRSAPIPFPPC